MISQVDLMPMVLASAGIPEPEGLQGSSRPEIQTDRAVFSSATRDSQGVAHAIIAGNLKLIVSPGGTPEMYDLASDAREQHNLYSPGDDRAKELSQRLGKWLASALVPSSKL